MWSFLHEIHVACHISLQNLVKWTEQAFETLTIQIDTLAITLRENVGSTWLVPKQRKLSKEVTWLVLHDNLVF